MKIKACGQTTSVDGYLDFRFNNGSRMKDHNQELSGMGFKSGDRVVMVLEKDLSQMIELIRQLTMANLTPEKNPNKTKERF